MTGIEHIPELVEWSLQNLNSDDLSSVLEDGSIEMITGDGRQGIVILYITSLPRIRKNV